ncbi:MAG: helix-hairpin-helix domain-containing protein [bacterium]|nr:helix-hairpin-helix domain-containing protein [bacterium]
MFIVALFIFIITSSDSLGTSQAGFEGAVSSDNLADELQTLKDNPISINTAKEQELLSIYWVTPELAKSIILTRQKSGKFKKISDLKNVPGMTGEILKLITPYIRLGVPTKPDYYSIQMRQRVQDALPEIEDTAGIPYKTYTRLKVDYKNISSSALIEKDYYEKSYYDFASVGIMLQNYGVVEKIVAGDYILDFAENLFFGIPPGVTFKSQGMIKGRSKGIKLNTTSGENNFLRGTAIELKPVHSLKNYLFFASTPIDGKIEDDEIKIYYDYEGDHSTSTGMEKKDRIKENLLGTRFEYNNKLKAGTTVYKNIYYSNPEGNELGTHNTFSMDLSGSYTGIEWFTETGKCDSVWAGVAGLEYRKPEFKIGSLYRYYPSLFYTFHGTPFSDRSITTAGELAEKGNYLYAAYKVSNNTLLNCYCDFFARLPNSDLTKPTSNGTEYSFDVEQKVNNIVSLTGKYAYKKLDESIDQQFRLQTDISCKNKMHFRFRIERMVTETSTGNSGYVGIGGRVFKKLLFDTRVALFETTPLMYEYESDLPGLMTNQCISGKGKRWYLFLKYNIYSALSISGKYSMLSKEGTSGSQKYGLQLDFKK